MTNQLALSNVINVSVATPQTGISAFNTSNLALFTREAPAATFGVLGYKIYLEPTSVATDFGTGSNTYAMAVAMFSQQPNILANGGYLVIIPFLTTAQTAVQQVSFPATPASGTFELSYNSNPTTALPYNVSAAAVQTALRLVSGLASVTVTGSVAAGFTVTFTGVSGPASLMTIAANSLVDANSTPITPTVVTTQVGAIHEQLDAAIVRTKDLVQYFGIMQAEVAAADVQNSAAAVVQALNKICFFVSYTATDVLPGGLLDQLRTGGFTHSRGLLYCDVLATALKFMAAYAGLGLSTNFSGSNTTQTMNLKTLSGIQPDPTITQTIQTEATAAGADTYPSIQGVPKVLCSGGNDFYDNVYNTQAFVGELQAAEFNALATTNTKVPQTEAGMNILKGSARQVCEQFVANGFIAPGAWTSPTTFGNQTDLFQNIEQRGYYIYSSPISQQLPTDRAARKAPLVQLAIKFAGAIHSASLIVNVNP